MMTFQPGYIVKLRAGGPKMVVRKAGSAAFGKQAIFCVWFDHAKKAEASFDATTLESCAFDCGPKTIDAR
jgi:uncharacterized protein YodC (DUF2158 family)